MLRRALSSAVVTVQALAVSTVATPQEILPQVIGDVEVVDLASPRIEPIEADAAVYWSEIIARPSARFIRLRVTVVSAQTSGDARFRVSTASESNAYSIAIDSTMAGMSFWTPPIAARQIEAAIVGSDVPVGLQVTIDRVAFTTQPGRVNSVIGLDNRQPIVTALDDPLVAKRQGAIASLSFMKGGKMYVCTGFLVDDSVLVTNEHCINTPDTCPTLVAAFGYQEAPDGRINRGTTYPCESLLDFDHELDYALIRLAGQPGRTWGTIALQTGDVAQGERLFVIQHPAGEPQQISMDDCAVKTAIANGRGNATDFAHTCDTLGGSSGSPVFSRNGRLVGLHHFGIGGGFWNENRAVRISRVLQDSATLRQLAEANP